MAKKKLRLDILLKRRGLAPSRAKAQAMIMAGSVTVEGRTITKAGFPVCETGHIEVKTDPCPFVSRGGLKLQAALDHFGISVKSRVCMDVGASTGGFTHCLLLRGARLVYAVDVGYGQLDWQLRDRQDVVNLEKTNVRYLSRQAFDELPDLATIDTSFISLRLVIPKVVELIGPCGEMIALVKPQFEAGREKVGKGGVVRSPKVHEHVLQNLIHFFSHDLDLLTAGPIASPIRGARGNKEFFVYLKKAV